MNALNFYLIRHAQSERNESPEIICGRSSDIGLSKLGEKQCKKLLKRLKKEKLYFDYAYSSSAKRALDTFSRTSFLSPLKIAPELLELSQGDWEGYDRRSIYTDDVLEEIRVNPGNFKAPNGENQLEAADRMATYFDKILYNLDEKVRESNKPLNVGVYGHGFAFKCLFIRLFEFNAKYNRSIQMENTGITHISFDYWDDKWTLHYLNDYSHLR